MPGDYDDDDERTLLRVQSPSGSESDIESQSDVIRNSGDKRKRFIKRLLSRARELNGRRAELSEENRVRESAPPEWLLLLIGCLLGLGTGLCVALFNNAVHSIHTWSWAGTPHEGAAWLRQQRLADTWHRVLLVPLTGGVIVGVMHGLLEIFDQLKQSRTQSRQKFDFLAALFPTVKAVQAAVTLGTGCSLGPEGPSVDIGVSCANGLAEMIKNNKDSRIALTAAGAAAGISSGFNAPLAGCFFAFETVLRHNHSSLPIMTAMIILASVLSSTVSNAIFGGKQAFTVPTYELKSVAELPLYLILGMICGGVSVIFTHLVAWFTKWFEFIKEHFKMPAVINPALGGLGAGIIALRYPGILYWGFTNVDEILHTGKSASAPGIWLITQLVCAKVVATSLCKGSGLVGGLYAPSLMFGAAAGAVFGGLAAEVINAIIPGNEAVAHPQAYALVGMAATLASACSVPLTSVLLLFELTKDYRILLPLMGAVGLAYWEASVARLSKENESGTAHGSSHSSYHALTITEVDKPGQSPLPKARDAKEVEMNGGFSIVADDELLHHIKVSEAMSKHILKVSLTATIKEVMKSFMESHQNCALVVSEEDRLEGILTLGDLQRKIQTSEDDTCGDAAMLDVNTTLVSSVCTRRIHYRGNERRILVCYPDNDLMIAKEIMEARGVKQLPVVERNAIVNQEGHTLAGLLSYESIVDYLRAARNKPAATFPKPRQYKENEISLSGH